MGGAGARLGGGLERAHVAMRVHAVHEHARLYVSACMHAGVRVGHACICASTCIRTCLRVGMHVRGHVCVRVY